MTKSVLQDYADKLRELTIESSTATVAVEEAEDRLAQAKQALREAGESYEATVNRSYLIRQELNSIKTSMRELLNEC